MGTVDSPHRRAGTGRTAALLLFLAFVPAVAHAGFRVEVEVTRTGGSPDTLVAAFRLHGVLADGDSSAVGEGLPATLTLVADLRRVRAGWWDPLVGSRTIRYRFRHDVLRDRYEVVDPAGTLRVLPDREALRAVLERRHEIVLGPVSSFRPGARYYVSVRAVLQPLDLDDLEKVDAWLSGEVAGGRLGGGILGIPRALVGIVVDLSGLGDRSAEGRSEVFVARE